MINRSVKEGYEIAADDYAANRNQFNNSKYLEQFSKLIEKGKTILDVGCGAGLPVDRFLIKKGLAVNGIDISMRMIELAKQNVPQAFFEVKDMSELKGGEYCVNGIVSFYAIFHTPKEKHQELLKNLLLLCQNGGFILVTLGFDEWEGSEENFHGAKMFWSQYGKEKNTEMIKNAGFKIILDEVDSAGGEKHQVIIAKLG